MPNNLAWVNCGTVTNAIMNFFCLKFFSLLSFSFFLLSLSSFFFLFSSLDWSLSFLSLSLFFLSLLTHISLSLSLSLSLSQPHHSATSSCHTSSIASPSLWPCQSRIATSATLPHPPRHAMPPNVSLICELGFFGFVCVFGMGFEK